MVLAALAARAELAHGRQQIHVVAAHEALRHADDRGLQRGLAVVVAALLRHVARELRHLRLLRLKAAE